MLPRFARVRQCAACSLALTSGGEWAFIISAARPSGAAPCTENAGREGPCWGAATCSGPCQLWLLCGLPCYVSSGTRKMARSGHGLAVLVAWSMGATARQLRQGPKAAKGR